MDRRSLRSNPIWRYYSCVNISFLPPAAAHDSIRTHRRLHLDMVEVGILKLNRFWDYQQYIFTSIFG